MLQDFSTSNQKPLHRRILGWRFAICLVAFAILFGNLNLVSGKMAPQWDAVDFFGPAFSYVAEHVKHGRLVFWDPWVDAGSPDFAEPELGTTSPILLVVALLSPNPQAGFVAYWIIIWLLGGVGVVLLARHLGAPAWGGALAALGFISSGFYTGHSEHTSSLYSVSFLPYILWRFDAALAGRNYWFAVQAGALYGLSALGGHPEFTILTPLFLALWAIGRLFFSEKNEALSVNRKLANKLVTAVLLLLVTSCIGAIIYSPSYTAIVSSTRGFTDRIGYRSREEALTSNTLPLEAYSTLSSPYLAVLNLPPNGIWSKTDVAMSSIYMGAGVIILGWLALWRSTRWRWWLFGIATLFAACSVGNELPVRGWLYDYLLPTRYFRNASNFSAYVILLFAVLACFGAKDITSSQKRSKEREAFCTLSILLAFAAVTTFTYVVRSTTRVFDGYHLAVTQLVLVWFGLAVISVLFYRGAVSKNSAVRLIVAVALVDAVLTFHVAQPIMYAEAALPWWHAMNVNERARLDLTANGLTRELTPPEALATYPNNRNLLLKIPTLQSYVTLWNRFEQQLVADPSLRQMALGPNRIWFCWDPVWGPPDNSDFTAFTKRVHEEGKPVLVLHSPEQMLALALRTTGERNASGFNEALAKAEPCSAAPISKLSYRPNWLSFDYVAPAKGWLLVTDRWAPDWKLRVNGRPNPIFGGDFLFRAVRVEAGDNQIEFRFRPIQFFLLLIASWTTLAIVAGVQVYKLVRSAMQVRQPRAFQAVTAGR